MVERLEVITEGWINQKQLVEELRKQRNPEERIIVEHSESRDYTNSTKRIVPQESIIDYLEYLQESPHTPKPYVSLIPFENEEEEAHNYLQERNTGGIL